MLEREIEQQSCRWAVNEGWLQFKFTSPAHRSVPDRMLIKEGRVVFIEYKQPTGKLTPGQVRERDRLVNAGAEYHLCSSLAETKKALGDHG